MPCVSHTGVRGQGQSRQTVCIGIALSGVASREGEKTAKTLSVKM